MLVSIITPTYNQAAFLPETIESVLTQDYESLEYIVIDDGSTDTTAQVLSAISGQFVSVRQNNKGQSATINRGFGGSMHAFFPPFGVYPNNAIVGGSADIAVGAALMCAPLAAQTRPSEAYPKRLIEKADRLAWLYNWYLAGPLYAEAEKPYEQ
jgi:glycosyltransferase involved in cell wall biosynthesis